MRIPSGVRTMIELPETCITVPLLTSVTVTGWTVVVVVMVAVPLIPGLSSCTDSCWPFIVNRESSGLGGSGWLLRPRDAGRQHEQADAHRCGKSFRYAFHRSSFGFEQRPIS